MQLAGHPAISMHQVLFGRHPPVLSLVFFSHSNERGLVALLAIRSFIFWKLAFAISSHTKTASCLSIAWSGSVWWLRCGMKFPMYVTIPMKLASCCLSVGGGGHFCYSLYLLWTGMHAISTVLHTKE